ncbi:hypothetical protein N7509_004487 [Penicillium cosmopolitanum]|uniref:DUF7703 domain-containing protein n=1 Tax=Penicillium cosmopolitanum TaxID=1131564 RepID=A0A9W9W795_9EURO|nr:uncharacterized protein N7509_004487 [Penicillium cosmopolitanum]KAJ5404616.1 hypothetical protein N7509_004487 [Penicillium cosmopolitanum]
MSSTSGGIIVIVFISIALYNALELLILILLRFNHYQSLYFWSLLLSNILGVIPTSVGTSLEFFALAPLWLSLTISNIGFCFMVPGQSVVLYSRLHLVSQNYKALLLLRYLILLDTALLIIPSITLNFGSEYILTPPWKMGYSTMERIQVTWFSAQETLISGIYIVETVKMIRLSPEGDKRRIKILYELLALNLVAIAMDISLIVLEYMGFYFLQIILKGTVYSVKLKMEFAVLGLLVSIVSVPLPTTGLEMQRSDNCF